MDQCSWKSWAFSFKKSYLFTKIRIQFHTHPRVCAPLWDKSVKSTILIVIEPSFDNMWAGNLTGNGFRYAPSTEAWQRQLNGNAIYAADCIKCIQPLTGERPTELQKRARQEAAAEKAAAPEQPQEETQGAELEDASTPETFYKVEQNPYSDSQENSYLFQEYVAQDNGMAKLGDIFYTGTPEKCRELLGKLETKELTQGDVKDLYAKAQEA